MNKLNINKKLDYSDALEATDHIILKEKYDLFINGEFVKPNSKKYFDTINPATDEIIARVAGANKKDVDFAVNSARRAFKSWSKIKGKDRGKYIFRQDSDDISFNNRLDEQIKILETKDVKTCTTRAIDINNNKIIPGLSSWIPKKITMKFKNPYIHGTLAIEKLLLNSIGNYSEDFYYSQDFRLYLDLLQKNEKIYEIKKPLYKLNTSNNISTLNKDEQKYYFKKALNKKW